MALTIKQVSFYTFIPHRHVGHDIPERFRRIARTGSLSQLRRQASCAPNGVEDLLDLIHLHLAVPLVPDCDATPAYRLVPILLLPWYPTV